MMSRVSIHLMLLFILIFQSRHAILIKFQYISCCYLSLTTVFILLMFAGFNTSHVVIYPTVFKHFFFPYFPFIPYFKAFSEILPAFFHFYIFLLIIVQTPCIYRLFSLFKVFSAGKISSSKHL